MREVVTCLSALALSLSTAWDEPARLEFKTHGFSIEALEESSELPMQVVLMTLPRMDGFTPNINVQVQPYPGSVDEYVALTIAQCKQQNLTVVKTETRVNRAVFEYTGEMQEQQLHFYAIACKRGKKIILVTAAATQAQWPKVSKKLLRCAESLKLDEAK